MALPPRHGAVAEYTLTVRITAEERKALRGLAKTLGVTLSGLAADALAEMAGDAGEDAPLPCRRWKTGKPCPGCHTLGCR
jgi:hypothetical protein